MSDRRTFASKFENKEPEPDLNSPLQTDSVPTDQPPKRLLDPEPRLGKDLSHQNFSSTPGKLGRLEGDSPLERLRPYLVISLLAIFFIAIVAYNLAHRDELKSQVSVENKENVVETLPAVLPLSSRRDDGVLNQAIGVTEDNTITLGGYERLKRLSSIILRGQIQISGEIFSFNLFGRRPNYYRLVCQINDADQYIVGFDGKTAWEEYKREGSSVKSTTLSKQQEQEIRSIADFDLPPQKYILASEYSVDRHTPTMTATYVTRELIDNTMYDIIQIKEDGKPAITCFLGSSNNLLYQTIVRVEGIEQRVVYENYRKIDGVYVPFHREQYTDGKLVATIQIESADFNPGTLIGLFSQPNSPSQ
ncbi:hypothetical protein [Cerasicoccus arenae]|nr:hypothetical protein [Cerasicoccus arenae]MBK1856804.1 hypothetical protein [Cerasicoccus arenae]